MVNSAFRRVPSVTIIFEHFASRHLHDKATHFLQLFAMYRTTTVPHGGGHSWTPTFCSLSCIIALRKLMLRMGLSRWLRCCEYIAPKW